MSTSEPHHGADPPGGPGQPGPSGAPTPSRWRFADGVPPAWLRRVTVALGVLVVLVLHDEHRSEEHTSELQSRGHLVCRLLLDKKKDCLDRFCSTILSSTWYVGG